MRRVKLGQICEVVSGGTPKTNVEEYWNGEFNWITPAEINDNETVPLGNNGNFFFSIANWVIFLFVSDII